MTRRYLAEVALAVVAVGLALSPFWACVAIAVVRDGSLP